MLSTRPLQSVQGCYGLFLLMTDSKQKRSEYHKSPFFSLFWLNSLVTLSAGLWWVGLEQLCAWISTRLGPVGSRLCSSRGELGLDHRRGGVQAPAQGPPAWPCRVAARGWTCGADMRLEIYPSAYR